MELEKARPEQLTYHWQGVVEAMCALSRGEAQIKDWSYRPPTSDDWREWRGVTRWCAYDAIYKWHMDRLSAIGADGKPEFCWQCHYEEDKPALKGFAASKCFDHAWLDYLADEALNAARRLGAPVTCPSCGRSGNPGPAAGEHYAECTDHRRDAA